MESNMNEFYGKGIDFQNGETGMTDYQFKCYLNLRDKCEALKQEKLRVLIMETLRRSRDLPEAITKVEALLDAQA